MLATIIAERPDTPDALMLIDELQAHLESFYPPESRHGFSVERLIKEGVAFFVLRVDGAPAGCGGIKLFGREFGELKRMYVRPESAAASMASCSSSTSRSTPARTGSRSCAWKPGSTSRPRSGYMNASVSGASRHSGRNRRPAEPLLQEVTRAGLAQDRLAPGVDPKARRGPVPRRHQAVSTRSWCLHSTRVRRPLRSSAALRARPLRPPGRS